MRKLAKNFYNFELNMNDVQLSFVIITFHFAKKKKRREEQHVFEIELGTYLKREIYVFL